MGLEVRPLGIPEVLLLQSPRHGDARGFFSETYNKKTFAEAGIDLDFVQDNHSLSVNAGTIRGLHFQSHPYAQDKLVRVVKGRILDVAVDIRRASPTFGKYVAAEISADDWNQILIPIGFAHGLCTLEPDTEVVYKVTNYYSAKHDLGIRWNDPQIGIDWPVDGQHAQLSEKDKTLPFLDDADVF
jgi:dTDP-4-dehydrorhamnose 3,5-epimerase